MTLQDVQATLPSGTVIMGRYGVERLLGKGGFGAVYLVKDQRVKGNLYALKEVFDPNKRERVHVTFEGEVLKRLDYPALPRVYRTFDDDERSRAYILMDYIEGKNLEKLRLQQPDKRFPISTIMRLVAPIVNALSYLHHQQPPIIHRDIKPANIIVPSSGDDTVLVDFGIAKEYDQDSTTTAVRRCSPGYGAPEQYAMGTSPRTDIYGLAATIYTLLTGSVPTDALYRMTTLGSKQVDPLESPSALVPAIPQAVSTVLVRAMAINSDERFETIEEFWQALKESATTAPVDVVIPATDGATVLPRSKEIPERTTQIVPQKHASPTDRKRVSPFLWIGALVIALALLSASVWGAVTFYSNQRATGPAAPATATSPTRPSPTQAEPTPTPTPSPTPNPTPTPEPTVEPTTPPAPVIPTLASSYGGTINNKYTTPPTNSTMDLSQIRQDGTAISGNFVVGTGLLASDSFTGTITAEGTIQFTVPSYSGLAPLLFTGQRSDDGNLSGTYCSYRGDLQCDKSLGGWGDWSVTPNGPPAAK